MLLGLLRWNRISSRLDRTSLGEQSSLALRFFRKACCLIMLATWWLLSSWKIMEFIMILTTWFPLLFISETLFSILVPRPLALSAVSLVWKRSFLIQLTAVSYLAGWAWIDRTAD